ncbi:MAG: hypothetical protein WC262_10635 [Bacteroidales bacterium]|jgi:hypothetical protein
MATIKLSVIPTLTPELALDCVEKACGGKVLKKAEDDKNKEATPEPGTPAADKATAAEEKKDTVEKAEPDTEGEDGDNDEEPEFDDSDFEDSAEYKAFAPLVLQAYKFWLAALKGDKEPKKGYEWANPEAGEKPKDFAERVAEELRDTQEGADIIELVGDDAEYLDFVEAIMWASDLDKEEVVKALESGGVIESMTAEDDEIMQKAVSTGMFGGYTDTEALDVTRLSLHAHVREYKERLDRYDEYKEREATGETDQFKIHREPCEPGEFVDGVVGHEIDSIIWEVKKIGDANIWLKIARHMGGIDPMVQYIRKTLWAELKNCGLVDVDPMDVAVAAPTVMATESASVADTI